MIKGIKVSIKTLSRTPGKKSPVIGILNPNEIFQFTLNGVVFIVHSNVNNITPIYIGK